MYVTDDMIAEMQARFGRPAHKSFRFETPEFDYIRSTQTNGRNHDVTIYMVKDGKVAVIAKHFYPPDLYRAPSGGLKPGENFITGTKREMREEIGCDIEPERFLLTTSVDFIRQGIKADIPDENDIIHWRSFVFLARYLSGDFRFTDKREIRGVRLADWSEFDGFCRTMRTLSKGGFHYRAALHEAVMDTLQKKTG